MIANPEAFGRVFGIDMSGDLKPGPTELNLGIIHTDRRNADLVMAGPHRESLEGGQHAC